MKTKQALMIGAALIAATLFTTLLLYAKLPERIPIHWNIRGEVDGWGDKRWAVFLMPGTMALLVGMILGLPILSPRGFRIQPFLSTFNYLMIACTALMGYLHGCMLLAALHPDLETGRMLMGGLFLFIALIGNVMGKTRRNFWMGVRTPWTLASETVWVATHRLAGQLWVGVGIAGAIAVWLGVSPVVCFTALMVAMLFPVFYSYVYYRRLQ